MLLSWFFSVTDVEPYTHGEAYKENDKGGIVYQLPVEVYTGELQ